MVCSFGRSLTCALLVFGACAASSAQNWSPEGSITSRQYQNQIREGNTVTATDFFTLEYSVATWIEDTGLTRGPYMNCTNKCKGKVHKSHPTCDFSCDEKCTEVHSTTVKGSYTPDRAAMNAATQAANGLAARGGGTHSPSDWSHRVSQALAEFRNEAKKEKTFEMPHAGPCSGRRWNVGSKQFLFHVRGTMKKVGYRMSRGMRTPINETVGTHESVVAYADIVQDEPHSKSDWADCKCLGVEDPPVDWKALWELIDKAFEDLLEEREATMCGTSALYMKNKAGEPVDAGESKVTVKPADMNRCVVEVENSTGQDVEVTIPAGTVFEAVNKADQDMASMVSTKGFVLAGRIGTLYVSLGPVQDPTSVQMPVRWACLNIKKKEPSPASRYRMRAPQDDVLVRLATITNRSRVRGPHDQARVWIYTDKAPLEEINKRMFPGVSEGRYATLLWEVGTAGGVDLTAKEYAKCLDPKLLAGVPLDDKATAWLVSILAETKPRELASYVNGNTSTLTRLLDSDPEYAPSHLATLATSMLNEDNADVRKAGVKLISSVPAGSRAAFAGAGGLTGLRAMLTSGNSADASSALDVLVSYPKELASDLLGASWEQLPTDAMKEKARKHLGIEAS